MRQERFGSAGLLFLAGATVYELMWPRPVVPLSQMSDRPKEPPPDRLTQGQTLQGAQFCPIRYRSLGHDIVCAYHLAPAPGFHEQQDYGRPNF